MPDRVPFWEAFRYWLKLGFISFGGPAGQISMMHQEVVEKKGWVSENHFLQALNFCMLLPGPEALQLAIYIGRLCNGTLGGIVAGVLFILPSIFILLGLAYVYSAFGDVPAISAMLYGLKPAVVAIVAEAVLRIRKKSLKNWAQVLIAVAAFVGIFFLHIPFPLIVLAAGLTGWAGGKYAPGLFIVLKPKESSGVAEVDGGRHWPRALKVIAFGLLIWFMPLALIWGGSGQAGIFTDLGILFSKAAVTTFGGAYAVLTYVGQEAVNHYGWITNGQMMDGLALAETTPGPLIMVNQFVGYVAAYSHPGALTPWEAGTLGGLLTTWVTFLPSFIFVLALAPYVERLRRNVRLSGALSAITAAVVGVVLNLGVTFTFHSVVRDTGGMDFYPLVTAVTFFVGIQYRNWPMVPVIAGSAVMGFLWKSFVVL